MISISHYELSISISNIPAANAYGIYISQLIDIPEIANNESAEPNVQYWLSCSKPPFNSFTIATMTWLTVTQYLYHKWPRICPFVVITTSSFPYSHLIIKFVTRHDGIHERFRNCHPSRTPEFNPSILRGSCCSIFSA